METRLATTADIPALAALHAASFGGASWNAKQIGDSLSLDTTQSWVVTQDHQPQGFILCQLAGDEAEILTFCVAPNARRQGVGQHLVTAALDFARQKKASRMFLEVAVDNSAALALYAKNGFRVTGKRAGYYAKDGHAIDAAMLTLDLA